MRLQHTHFVKPSRRVRVGGRQSGPSGGAPSVLARPSATEKRRPSNVLAHPTSRGSVPRARLPALRLQGSLTLATEERRAPDAVRPPSGRR
jgi:hypothetical protein